jgi:2-methylaconitate cis-trans-isomerase PrpF
MASHLPRDARQRDALLISAMGAGHELQIDGIGGGNPLTSKVAIVGPATVSGADVDYLFAQVKVVERVVDTSPNCGNMLSAVGPFAIEAGLVRADEEMTTVRIHNVNTGKIIEARVSTPRGQVSYEGDTAIDGVPGTAAPVHLAFADAAGSKTGKLFPTGRPTDTIQCIEATCIDAAMPLVIVRAADLGKTGHEPPVELESDRSFMSRLEALRVEAGQRMGFARAAELVIPKPVLVATPRGHGAIAGRYFMPASCHKAFAITGAVGLATACVKPGTVAADLTGDIALPRTLTIEHPSGRLDVRLERVAGRAEPVASLVRTARRLFEGAVFVHVPGDTVRAEAI